MTAVAPNAAILERVVTLQPAGRLGVVIVEMTGAKLDATILALAAAMGEAVALCGSGELAAGH
jgi:hypothetical protein